jgi:cyclic beta-1,2-glucan synthetase
MNLRHLSSDLETCRMLTTDDQKNTAKAILIGQRFSGEAALRDEPFSVEHLEDHARLLSEKLTVDKNKRHVSTRYFQRRILENGEVLRAAHAELTRAIIAGENLTTDAEWLLDNFTIVEEQLRQIREDLPHGFYRELPKTGDGLPLVYSLALELIAHSDSALDQETIARFLLAYQEETPLSIGEVWAFPVMLRFALVENLRRLAMQLRGNRTCRVRTHGMMEQWCTSKTWVWDEQSLESCAPIALELMEQQHDDTGECAARLKEFEKRLTALGIDPANCIRQANQQQAVNQVTIGNVITSMRLISALDWMAFFERVNVAEQVLRKDPAGIYMQMDPLTRNRYRQIVEKLAKWGKGSDIDVAREVLILSRVAKQRVRPDIEQHVGYYLVDEGRAALEKALNIRPPVISKVRKFIQRYPTGCYLGLILLVTALIAAGLAAAIITAGWGTAAAISMSLLVVLPASEVAMTLANYLVTRFLPPRLLPKLELREGIPAAHAAIIVVPCMLTSRDDFEAQLDRLETHYLANPETALRFALLTDFADANSETLPTDEELIEYARTRVQRLNHRYAHETAPPFLWFHRRRQWNPAEGVWLGWERKRGKLMEFNRLLRGDTGTSYSIQEGDLAALLPADGSKPIRYVITLDADTQLPSAAARRMIGTLAHPLNRAQLTDAGTVERGYVLLQPRIGINLEAATRSPYARLFAASPGIDPYVTAASDVYQDLFGEGSFTGKGIYDLDALEHTLQDAFPENTILSHDLIEGCYARTALVSDIEVYDGYPAHYGAEAKRQHRWTRGDWQISPWLLPRVPSANGWRPNSLSLFSRWKIFDNLRRSLVPASLLAMLLVGWCAFPTHALAWTGLAFALVLFPLLLTSISLIRRWSPDITWHESLRVAGRLLGSSLAQNLLTLVLLPHRAYLSTDAIARTAYRTLYSHRHLLEWETAAASEQRFGSKRGLLWKMMWFSPVIALAVFVLTPAEARWVAYPLALLWLAAPAIADWMSTPYPLQSRELDTMQRQWLRGQTRRIWSFFEKFVTIEGNWLPPDNFQEYPSDKIAYRLSPTNEGLYLVAGLIARDFGYLSLHQLAGIWERNLGSLQCLEKLHGHFLNWYETQTRRSLHPRYVSTVDSGNLAACFLTAAQGISDLRQRPVFDERITQGLQDTLQLIEQCCEPLPQRGARMVNPPRDRIIETIKEMRALSDNPQTPSDWFEYLDKLHGLSQILADNNQCSLAAHWGAGSEVPDLVTSLVTQIQQLRVDLDELFPWLPVVPQVASSGSKEHWAELREHLEASNSLDKLLVLQESSESLLAQWLASGGDAELHGQLQLALARMTNAARTLSARYNNLAEQMQSLARGMDFTFLYNKQRQLFSIGFNLEEGQLDRSHYDMLASEARLASYLAITKGDVEYRTWFRMGRQLTDTGGNIGLLSWGGTMFEFLMPELFHRRFPGSLLTQSCETAVKRQIEYGRQNHAPWGISESAFSALAANADYNYRSFGVPGLGLKRGLAKDYVVSPYSTFMALEINALAGYENLQRLATEGALGHWGFYDALDYTAERLPAGKKNLPVRCYMAHHQGMSLLGLANLLDNESVRRRFNAHPLGRAGELLLQERMPIATSLVEPPDGTMTAVHLPQVETELVSRKITGYSTPTPRTNLISNGKYAVMVTNTGGGYSQHRDLAITRWRSDATRDQWGQFLYLRNLKTGDLWSATYEPTRAIPSSYQVTYSIDKAEFHRRDGMLETHLEITVSPEHQAEHRLLKITNHGSAAIDLEITSYAEVALTSAAADAAHPAFQKLFVETSYLAEKRSILARRRPRDARDNIPWAVHTLAAGHGTLNQPVEWESSRELFLGRGHTLAEPAAFQKQNLSGSTGAVLDPIFSLRGHVTVQPHESVSIAFTTAYAASENEALALADQFHDLRGVQRAFEMAWAYSQVELRHRHLSPAMAHLFQRIASSLLYPDPLRRTAEKILANRQGQSGLWRYGISGDRPILVLRITKPEQIEIARELLSAHAFWRAHGLLVDLAIINDNPGSYLDALQDQLVILLNEMPRVENHATHVYLLRGAQLPEEDQILIEAAAAMVLHCQRGSLTKQFDASSLPRTTPPAVKQPPQQVPVQAPIISDPSHLLPQLLAPQERQFWNGFGGFNKSGDEYQMNAAEAAQSPKPWSNVIANAQGGCLVTEAGGGYTWVGNSREYKLSTWCNDPVLDEPGEWLYVYDHTHEELWHPLRASAQEAGTNRTIVHGQGFSRFQRTSYGMEVTTTISYAPEDPVKLIHVTLRNKSSERRTMSLAYYVEWVLGVNREQTQLHVVTDIDTNSGALTARNAYHPEYGSSIAFLNVIGGRTTWTGDRREFLGRNTDPAYPQAMAKVDWSKSTGAGVDPCGAIKTEFEIEAGKAIEIVIVLGAGTDERETQALLERYSHHGAITGAIEQNKEKWRGLLDTVQVHTPNPAFDLMLNHWLLSQILGCRFWARTAFYQAGGAYGFRDQLQDVMALVHAKPELARQHLLRAASRQFIEGDVQHWWHPPTGRGTRTRFSDDYLWLPLVAAHYVEVTGDDSVLHELASFLESPLLEPHEHERYELPHASGESASLYEHCLRTLRRAFRLGPHDLPLMGCGDWNDGMNKIGEHGQGESVWVGWFLLVILDRFVPLIRQHGSAAEADDLLQKAAALRAALEREAWDGEWYRRAFFDDGTPLGSKENDECQIDSIPQTWAVFANAPVERTTSAMNAVWERLVKLDEGLVLLFTPPFDKTTLDPGYIKGYLPGIRENGGQYTHPALWLIQALCMQGNAERAMRIFDLINPIHHAKTPDEVAKYQVEPYVIAADVYGVEPHVGRGGWSWYTGSAAWMYRAGLESILGFQRRGNRVTLAPCIPADWPEFEIQYRHHTTPYRIRFVNQIAQGDVKNTCDGQPLADNSFELVADGKDHAVVIYRNPGAAV